MGVFHPNIPDEVQEGCRTIMDIHMSVGIEDLKVQIESKPDFDPTNCTVNSTIAA